ncbi:TlpA family protein disulfide reductase [Acanthopleuribacter pedis]|uniref:TlpA family protein disulfide reductase n=1 Tax=Acanthopleuribacter pedis TaxID=442870 RepID=A0A8J7Q6U3_9BACT|nr:TlpA disulfide reductase family protein [Acanthopleuribacter pedis]MBO1319276.1 TlpA family protein disulfide reductase [Acanthopleuribacter pedis]
MKIHYLVAMLSLLPAGLFAGEPLRDQHGKTYDIDHLFNQVTVVDFAAAWCQPCWRALPHIQAFAKNHPEVQVLVVSQDDQIRGRDKLVKKLGLEIPVLWDAGHQLAEKMQPPGMPTTFVVDSEGKVVHSQVGFDEKKWAKTQAVIEKLLAARKNP